VQPEVILLLLVGPLVGEDAKARFLESIAGLTFDRTTILDLVNVTELDETGASALWTMVGATEPGVALIGWGATAAVAEKLGDHGLRRHIGLTQDLP
jgi:hypothetical protein